MDASRPSAIVSVLSRLKIFTLCHRSIAQLRIPLIVQSLRPLIVTLLLALISLACSSPQPPNNAQPASITFVDQNSAQGVVRGPVTIYHAQDESNITEYQLWWGDLDHCMLFNNPIAHLPKTGGNVSYTIPNTVIPNDAFELIAVGIQAGGSIDLCDGVYQAVDDLGTVAPTTIPKKLTVTKTTTPLLFNPQLETIDIARATNETNITHYIVYYYEGSATKSVQFPQAIAQIKATGSDLSYKFNEYVLAAYPAEGFMVCSRNYAKEYCGPAGTANRTLYSLHGGLNVATIIGTTLPNITGVMNAVLNNNTSCPGANIVASCGNRVCEINETAANCPSDCTDYAIASYNYQTICSDSSLALTYHPTTVAEIQSIVNNAVANNQHVKVVSGKLPLADNKSTNNLTGSASDFVCTDGVTIAMEQINIENPNFTTQITTFNGKNVVKVPAGTRLHNLGAWLHDRGYSVKYAHMGWARPTIGGNISTSAHGSSPSGRTVLAQRVVKLEMIGADGQLHIYDEINTDEDTFKALRTGLGYLGVIVNVWLEVDETTNLHVKATYHKESELFDGSPDSFFQGVAQCDWGQYLWYPGRDAFMKMCGMETTEAAEPGAVNTLLDPDVPDVLNIPMQKMMQAGSCDLNNGIMEFVELWRYLQLLITPPYAKEVNGVVRASGDVIGPLYQMQSGDLISSQGGFFQLDWEVAVPHTHMQEAALYIRNFLNGQNSKNRQINLPLVGLFARFGISEDKTLMAYTGTGGDWIDGEPVVFFEMPIYIPTGFDEAKMADYLAPYIEYTTYLITNYGARGHWGKNREWMFPLEASLGNINIDGRFDRFNTVVGELDPNGVFANAAGKRLGITYPGFVYPAGW